MSRYLAIDFGDKRTGLATGDDETRMAGPVGLIETCDRATLLSKIAQAIEEHGPDALVVGVPYNMDGTEGPAAVRIRQLAQEVARQHPLPIHFVDERLTSYQADQQMGRSGLTRKQKKQRRDALAAATILRDFLDQLGD